MKYLTAYIPAAVFLVAAYVATGNGWPLPFQLALWILGVGFIGVASLLIVGAKMHDEGG